MSIRNYSRGERETQIEMTIALSIQRGAGDELTMYRIARAIGLQPSMHVARILADMVASGKLKARWVENRKGRWDTVLYRLPEGSYTDPKAKPREIPIKVKGVVADQLKLFQPAKM